MARRTPEEILAQRDAWMARKAARDAGEDIPMQPPLKPGEVAETPTQSAPAEAVEAPAEPEAPQPVKETPQPEVAQPVPEPQPEVAQATGAGAPQRPAQRRTPAEVLAQREAWMARKAAQAAGLALPPAPAAQPAAAPAPKPVAAAKPAPKPKAAAAPAPKKQAEPAPNPIDPNITRRELLNYAWLASIGLFTAQSVGASLWFAFPNFKEGEFGGQFPLGPANSIVPEINSPPVPYTDGKFWLVNVEGDTPDQTGILALFKVCTHLGCLYDWADVTFRFECPCHGSKFSLNGEYIGGPARRSLDRFRIIARSADGTEKQTDDNGNPLVINGDEELIIDTGVIIQGSSDIIPA